MVSFQVIPAGEGLLADWAVEVLVCLHDGLSGRREIRGSSDLRGKMNCLGFWYCTNCRLGTVAALNLASAGIIQPVLVRSRSPVPGHNGIINPNPFYLSPIGSFPFLFRTWEKNNKYIRLYLNSLERLGKINLLIIQIIYVDFVVLLILRPPVPKPASDVVPNVFVLKVLPAGVRKYLHRVKRRS